MKTMWIAAAAAAAFAAAPGAAKPLTEVPHALDPAKAYILVEYRLLANPYGGFPGSRKTMPLSTGLTFARYDPAAGDALGAGKAKPKSSPPGQALAEGFRNKPLVKADASRLFLLEVDPGLWVVEGFGNTAFSLGSYSFTLEPGTVTDLGVVTAENDWAQGQRAPKTGDIFKMALAGPFAKHLDMAPMRVAFRPRAAGDIPVPAGIPAERIRAVAFTPDQKFGNYLGGLVNRIEGVNARLRAPAEKPTPAPAETQTPKP
jgi:hypothetical protein